MLSIEYIVSNGMTTDELERIWKEAVMASLRDCSDVCLEGIRKTTKKPQPG
jgi:hypothetical protein